MGLQYLGLSDETIHFSFSCKNVKVSPTLISGLFMSLNMNDSSFIFVSSEAAIVDWLQEFSNEKSAIRSMSRAKRIMGVLQNAFDSNLFTKVQDEADGGYQCGFNQLCSVYPSSDTSKTKILEKLQVDISNLCKSGVIDKTPLTNLPVLRNGRPPSKFTVIEINRYLSNKSPSVISDHLSAGRSNSMQYRLALSVGELGTTRGLGAVDIQTPENLQLSTLLVSRSARMTQAPRPLQVISEIDIFNRPCKLIAYGTAKEDSKGKALGRITLDDAKILYYLQARDSQIISDSLKSGDNIENRFSVDIADIARALAGNPRGYTPTGNTLVRYSNAMERIGGMGYECRISLKSEDEKEEFKKMFGSSFVSNEAVINLFHIRFIHGAMSSRGNYQRYFVYEYPEYEFKWMCNNIGKLVFPKVFFEEANGLQMVVYFYLRQICGEYETITISLRNIYDSIKLDDSVSFRNFSERLICKLHPECRQIEPGEEFETVFFGYSLVISRFSSVLESIKLVISGVDLIPGSSPVSALLQYK